MNPPRYYLGGFFVFQVSMARLEGAFSLSVASARAGSALGETWAFVAAAARLDLIWIRREAKRLVSMRSSDRRRCLARDPTREWSQLDVSEGARAAHRSFPTDGRIA
jgi:hypothetical protein